MAVRKSNGTWQADFAVAKVRSLKSFCNKREADEWEALELIRANAPDSTPAKPTGPDMLFKDAIQATYDRVWSGQKSAESSARNAQLVLVMIGNLPLKCITTEVIDGFVTELGKRGAAPGTVNRKLAAISRVLHFARSRGWINTIPYMERKREPEGRLRFFTAQEEADMIAAFRLREQHSMADLVILLADSGLRLGEAMKLIRTDAADGMILVTDAKSASGTRGLPQTSRVREMLAKRSESRPAGENRIFFDLSNRAVTHYWNRLRADFGRSQEATWVPHTLRHTFISRLVQRGVPLRVVMDMAGHSSILMTQRYAHLCSQNFQSAIEKLEEIPETVKPKSDLSNLLIPPMGGEKLRPLCE